MIVYQRVSSWDMLGSILRNSADKTCESHPFWGDSIGFASVFDRVSQNVGILLVFLDQLIRLEEHL